MVTKREIQEQVSQLAKLTARRLIVEWAYGQPRVHEEVGQFGGRRDVSPRLSKRDLALWLDGFSAAV